MYRVALIALVAAVAAVPANAQDGPAAVKEKKICKREVATGSIMPKTKCRTKAEWDAIAAAAQSDLDRTNAQDRSRSMVNQSR